jgi:ribonuclease HI
MVEIYTDGSCLRNPNGPSGSGVVMIYKNSVKTISIGMGGSTNNRAELFAIQKALEAIKPDKRHYPIKIYSDSKYAIGSVTGKMKGTKNPDLIHPIRQMLLDFPEVEFIWVKAHSGNRWNEIADRLALRGSRSAQGEVKVMLLDSHDHPYFTTL